MDWLERVRAGLREHEGARDEVASGETSASAGADLPAKPPAPARGHPERIGPLQVLRVLGQGAMGVVYAARSARLERDVAVKVLKLERVDSPALVERFEIEARAAARLRHPNIVGVHEVGADGDRRYLVMELVTGRSLAAHLREGAPAGEAHAGGAPRAARALPEREAATITERLARALAYAHERWVLHRDIKPANVLLCDETGEPMLGDFGLAKVLDAPGGAPSPTVSGQVMGTPAYMPPEQARGEHGRVDRRSDIYSLGATLYEMLSGQPPWSGSSVIATLARVTSLEPVLPPSRLRPGLDPELETICVKCLEKEPTERYLTADDLADDLARWLADEPIAARRPTPLVRARKWLRRNRSLVRALGAVLAVALLVLLAATVDFVRRLDDERARADAAAREASRQAERARARADVTHDALRVLIDEVRDELTHVPGARVRQVRAELLDHALGALERLRDAELAEGAPLEAAAAQRQIGDLRAARSDEGLGPAAAAFERAVSLCRDARGAAADDDRARHDLALSLLGLADVRRALGEDARAEALASEALELASAAPPRLLLLAAARRQLALIAWRRDDAPRAREHLDAAAAVARAAPAGDDRDERLLEVLEARADLLAGLGDLPAARSALEEAVVVARRLEPSVDAPPRVLRVLRALADILARQGDHLALAYALSERGDHVDAAEHFARALDDEALRADLSRSPLYAGACAAAQASARAPDDAARAKLRARALDWLREDARRRREALAQAPAAARAQAAQALARFALRARQDPALTALRGRDLDAIYPP